MGQCAENSEDSPSTNSLQDTEVMEGGYASVFIVPKMDCPSEERMIRLSLDDIQPKIGLEFDTPNRKVKVFHGNNIGEIEKRMESLGLGTPD